MQHLDHITPNHCISMFLEKILFWLIIPGGNDSSNDETHAADVTLEESETLSDIDDIEV